MHPFMSPSSSWTTTAFELIRATFTRLLSCHPLCFLACIFTTSATQMMSPFLSTGSSLFAGASGAAGAAGAAASFSDGAAGAAGAAESLSAGAAGTVVAASTAP